MKTVRVGLDVPVAQLFDYRADIDLSSEGGGTVIRWRGTFATTIPGTGGVLAFVFGRLMTSFARRAAAEADRRARGATS